VKLEINRAAQLIAAALFVVAITQLVYVILGGSGNSHIAYPIWRIETFMAFVVAILAFIIIDKKPLVGGCLAVAGIFNVIQTGLGLTMFYQLGYGGEEPPNPVFFPVLFMSFFLYFAAKAALGVATLVLGIELWQSVSTGIWRVIGVLSALAGLGALLLNVAAMLLGLGVVPFAGASGVVASLFVGVVLIQVTKSTSTTA